MPKSYPLYPRNTKVQEISGNKRRGTVVVVHPPRFPRAVTVYYIDFGPGNVPLVPRMEHELRRAR